MGSTHTYQQDPRNADIQININGELFHRDKAVISVFDSGGNLVLTGFARPGSVIELFLADNEPSGFGEGGTAEEDSSSVEQAKAMLRAPTWTRPSSNRMSLASVW